MPWCPKCRTEYREGFKVCSECKAELVDELESEETEWDIIEQDKEVYLISAANNIEAEMIESLLNSNGIPVLKKYKEAGGAYLEIYMGTTNLGMDLYVPSKLLVKAKEIVESGQEIITESTFEDDSEEEKELDYLDQKYNKKRRIRTWIVLLFFAPGLLFIIIGALYNLYNYFSR